MNSIISRNIVVKELRSRRITYLARSVAVRLWPLNIFARKYYRRRFSESRWGAVNQVSKSLVAEHPPCLSAKQHVALRNLRNCGVYQTEVQDFVGATFDFEKLQRDVRRLFQDDAPRRQIEQRHSNYGSKWYVVRVFGQKPQMAVPTSLAGLVLSDQVLNIANAYLGLFSRLIYLDVWHNLPRRPTEPAISSEYWHRDHEDVRLLKLFLYLTDVDGSSGPLEYIRRSQPGGQYDSVFPSVPPAGAFPPEGEVMRLIPSSFSHRCMGPAGTLVLYDSSGLHRGGKALKNARQAIVATFASDASLESNYYHLADPEKYSNLSEAARYAIRAPRLS